MFQGLQKGKGGTGRGVSFLFTEERDREHHRTSFRI